MLVYGTHVLLEVLYPAFVWSEHIRVWASEMTVAQASPQSWAVKVLPDPVVKFHVGCGVNNLGSAVCVV